jgi:hypothetical protein
MTPNDFSQAELDPEDEQSLQRQLKANRLRLKASEGLDTRVAETLRHFDAASEKSAALELTCPESHKPTLWRTIMRRRSTGIGLTTALAIIVGWALLFSPQAKHNRVWADMLETMKGMNWIYVKVDLDMPPDLPEEMVRSFKSRAMLHAWYRFEPGVAIVQKRDGVIEYTDREQGVRHVYLPTSNTVTIDSHTEQYDPAMPKSPFDIVAYYLDSFPGEVGRDHPKRSINSDDDVQEGRALELIQINHSGVSIAGVRDVERNLLTKIFFNVQPSPDNEATVNVEVHLSYPDNGPADIFAAGVSREAKIQDKRPEEEVITAIMQTVQAKFDHNYGNRICVLVHSQAYDGGEMEPRRAIISRKKQSLYRSDMYLGLHWHEEARDVWPKLTLAQALRAERTHGTGPFLHIFNGRHVYEGRPTDKSHSKRYFRASGPEASYSTWDINALAWVKPFDLGVKNARIKETITRLAVSPDDPEWIGLKIQFDVNERYSMHHELWIDPQRDNLVMRYTRKQLESLGGGRSQTFEAHRQILEAAQTANNQWYPLRVEIREYYPGRNASTHHDITDIRVLLDDEWTTSEPIFSKDHLFCETRGN